MPHGLSKLNWPNRTASLRERLALGLQLKMDHATTGGMGDDVSTPHRSSLSISAPTWNLAGVDGYAKTASYRLVGHPLGEKS